MRQSLHWHKRNMKKIITGLMIISIIPIFIFSCRDINEKKFYRHIIKEYSNALEKLYNFINSE